jgi:thioredoxin-like negative regulator of GroEL
LKAGSLHREDIVRCIRVAILFLTIILPGVPVLAAEKMNFDQDRFIAAQAEGRPILVDIWASWCPTCAAQQPIIERLAGAPEYKNLLILRVDFDTQKDVVRRFGARSQSTLIAFRGTRETGRSVGDTDEHSIAKLFRSTAN